MRRVTIVLCIVVTITLVIAGFKVTHAQSGFSNASLTGGYLLTTTGSDSIALGLTFATAPLNVSCFAPTAPSGANLESASITVLVPTSNTNGPNINCSNSNIATDRSNFAIMTPLTVDGDFQADGNGNITGGTGTVNRQTLTATSSGSSYTVVDNSCDFTFNGTYSIASNGFGTLSISPVGPCIAAPVTITFRVRLTTNGNAGTLNLNAVFTGRFNTILTGTLLKK